MANDRSADRSTRRPNRSTGGRAAGNLSTLALCASVFGHLPALVDVSIGYVLADFLQMCIGIENGFGGRTACDEKYDNQKTPGSSHRNLHLPPATRLGEPR
jgi:hypothetical protein